MPHELHVRIDARAIQQKLGGLARRKLPRALRRGFVRALDLGASAVSTSATQKLRQRSGTLASSITGQPSTRDKLLGWVGVPAGSPAERYAYLLTSGSRQIRPQAARALTIPIGANLTGAGRVRFPSVADLIAKFGQRVFFAKRFVGVRAKGKRGSWQIYFALSGGVTVQGRDVLDPALTQAQPQMVQTVQDEVNAILK